MICPVDSSNVMGFNRDHFSNAIGDWMCFRPAPADARIALG